MPNKSLVIGHFYTDETFQPVELPADREEMIAKVREILDRCPTATLLEDDDVAYLRSALPVIGADEVTADENGGQQGVGTIVGTASGAGIEVEGTARLSVLSVWESFHDRKRWVGDLALKKLSGDAKVRELAFAFNFVSFGMSPEGKFEVLFNKTYTRSFTDPYHVNDFNNGGIAQTSRNDISKFIQWGYFISATCTIRTSEGTMTI